MILFFIYLINLNKIILYINIIKHPSIGILTFYAFNFNTKLITNKLIFSLVEWYLTLENIFINLYFFQK